MLRVALYIYNFGPSRDPDFHHVLAPTIRSLFAQLHKGLNQPPFHLSSNSSTFHSKTIYVHTTKRKKIAA